MLVDLGRNDLGKISRFGTVKVEKLHSVERFSHVMHIGSSVSGRNKRGVRCFGCHRSGTAGRNTFRSAEDPGLSADRRTGEQQDGAFMAAPSVILILREIWIPVLQSAWHIRKTERFL